MTGCHLHPLGDGFFAFPQGSLAPQARAGSDPWHGREECDKHSPPGQFFDRKRWVAPSPAPYDPELRGQRGEFPRGTTGIAFTGLAQAVAKRGVGLVAYETCPRRGRSLTSEADVGVVPGLREVDRVLVDPGRELEPSAEPRLVPIPDLVRVPMPPRLDRLQERSFVLVRASPGQRPARQGLPVERRAVSRIGGRSAEHCVCRVLDAARPPVVRPGRSNGRASPGPPPRKSRGILPGRAFSRRPAANSPPPDSRPTSSRTRLTHTPRTPNPHLPASEPANVADGSHATRPRRRGWSSIIRGGLGGCRSAAGFEGATTGTGCVSIQSKGR